jgi:hypothetical protein
MADQLAGQAVLEGRWICRLAEPSAVTSADEDQALPTGSTSSLGRRDVERNVARDRPYERDVVDQLRHVTVSWPALSIGRRAG